MKLKLSVPNSVTIREKVFAAVSKEILNGRFSAGERIVETKIANEIQTSRTPVREALHMLEREGLLESIPRVGYRVKEVSWEEVEEICEIRAVNETLAARWAMERITPDKLRALEENITISEKEVRGGNPRAFVHRDGEFHEILVRASGSTRLLELCQLLRRHMLRYRIESLYVPEGAIRAIAGHRRILDCMEKKDLDRVEKAIRDHLGQSLRDIRHYAFEEKGDRTHAGIEDERDKASW